MILLDPADYSLAIEPLQEVPFNKLFALAVAERKVKGRIHVDQIKHPRSFYIVHPYGMTMLLGDAGSKTFNTAFLAYALNTAGERKKDEWMQTFPRAWDEVLPGLFASGYTEGRIDQNTRVNFKFSKERYQSLPRSTLPPGFEVIPADAQLAWAMTGSVVPSNFWDRPEDMFEKGAAFALLVNGELACMAFSSFRDGDQLEIGIETQGKFRGQGLAKWSCSALIDHCIEHGLEPLWACRKENTGSYRLALSLGFEPALEIPYYRIAH